MKTVKVCRRTLFYVCIVQQWADENGLFAMQGWILASNEVYEPSYVIRDLQPNTSYMFLVRAQNSHGLSFPSPVTAVIRTQG